jgi:hypothetical protein
VPRCLLRLRDRADVHPEFDGEGLQFWLDYELEALRYGVDPDTSHENLAALIEGSTVVLPREEHRNGHENDFVRWSRRGGLATLRRYGTSWFSLLARRRWERLSGAELEQVFATISSRLAHPGHRRAEEDRLGDGGEDREEHRHGDARSSRAADPRSHGHTLRRAGRVLQELPGLNIAVFEASSRGENVVPGRLRALKRRNGEPPKPSVGKSCVRGYFAEARKYGEAAKGRLTLL